MKINNDNGLSIYIGCDNCKTEFLINSQSNITFNKHFVFDEKSIFVVCVNCPNCGKTFYVQIDDTKTLKIKKEFQNLFIKIIQMKNKNIPVSKQNKIKYDKLRKNLESSRYELMKQYEGSVVTDTETGEKVTLNFTIV